MPKRLLETGNDNTAPLMRIVLAGVIFPHGAQHLLGWFGGLGFGATMDYFASLGIPAIFGLRAIIAEFFGSLGLLAGLLTRPAALGIGVVMAVAALTVHLPNGFFMNWLGNREGEGFEHHILAAGIAAVLAIKGGGALSVARLLSGSVPHDVARPEGA